jgi:hypothetical protein
MAGATDTQSATSVAPGLKMVRINKVAIYGKPVMRASLKDIQPLQGSRAMNDRLRRVRAIVIRIAPALIKCLYRP